MIIYKKGNLFDVPKQNTLLVHAVNCKGVWGSGIAVEFKTRFPKSFEDYARLCNNYGDDLIGNGFHYYVPCDDDQAIGYLFTSKGYGENKDSENLILKNTSKAVEMLLGLTLPTTEIHSPKINSGKFAVPWEHTEPIINNAILASGHTWIVWEQE